MKLLGCFLLSQIIPFMVFGAAYGTPYDWIFTARDLEGNSYYVNVPHNPAEPYKITQEPPKDKLSAAKIPDAECVITDMEEAVEDLSAKLTSTKENIYIFTGAGMSASQIPTLEAFYASLELELLHDGTCAVTYPSLYCLYEKLTRGDLATKKTIEDFLKLLSDEKAGYTREGGITHNSLTEIIKTLGPDRIWFEDENIDGLMRRTLRKKGVGLPLSDKLGISTSWLYDEWIFGRTENTCRAVKQFFKDHPPKRSSPNAYFNPWTKI